MTSPSALQTHAPSPRPSAAAVSTPKPAEREIVQQSKEDAHEIRKMREAVLLSPFTQGGKGDMVI